MRNPSLASGIKVFSRAVLTSALMVSGLAVGLGATTYALSAVSQPLWADNTVCPVTEVASVAPRKVVLVAKELSK